MAREVYVKIDQIKENLETIDTNIEDSKGKLKTALVSKGAMVGENPTFTQLADAVSNLTTTTDMPTVNGSEDIEAFLEKGVVENDVIMNNPYLGFYPKGIKALDLTYNNTTSVEEEALYEYFRDNGVDFKVLLKSANTNFTFKSISFSSIYGVDGSQLGDLVSTSGNFYITYTNGNTEVNTYTNGVKLTDLRTGKTGFIDRGFTLYPPASIDDKAKHRFFYSLSNAKITPLPASHVRLIPGKGDSMYICIRFFNKAYDHTKYQAGLKNFYIKKYDPLDFESNLDLSNYQPLQTASTATDYYPSTITLKTTGGKDFSTTPTGLSPTPFGGSWQSANSNYDPITTHTGFFGGVDLFSVTSGPTNPIPGVKSTYEGSKSTMGGAITPVWFDDTTQELYAFMGLSLVPSDSGWEYLMSKTNNIQLCKLKNNQWVHVKNIFGFTNDYFSLQLVSGNPIGTTVYCPSIYGLVGGQTDQLGYTVTNSDTNAKGVRVVFNEMHINRDMTYACISLLWKNINIENGLEHSIVYHFKFVKPGDFSTLEPILTRVNTQGLYNPGFINFIAYGLHKQEGKLDTYINTNELALSKTGTPYRKLEKLIVYSYDLKYAGYTSNKFLNTNAILSLQEMIDLNAIEVYRRDEDGLFTNLALKFDVIQYFWDLGEYRLNLMPSIDSETDAHNAKGMLVNSYFFPDLKHLVILLGCRVKGDKSDIAYSTRFSPEEVYSRTSQYRMLIFELDLVLGTHKKIYEGYGSKAIYKSLDMIQYIPKYTHITSVFGEGSLILTRGMDNILNEDNITLIPDQGYRVLGLIRIPFEVVNAKNGVLMGGVKNLKQASFNICAKLEDYMYDKGYSLIHYNTLDSVNYGLSNDGNILVLPVLNQYFSLPSPTSTDKSVEDLFKNNPTAFPDKSVYYRVFFKNQNGVFEPSLDKFGPYHDDPISFGLSPKGNYLYLDNNLFKLNKEDNSLTHLPNLEIINNNTYQSVFSPDERFFVTTNNNRFILYEIVEGVFTRLVSNLIANVDSTYIIKFVSNTDLVIYRGISAFGGGYIDPTVSNAFYDYPEILESFQYFHYSEVYGGFEKVSLDIDPNIYKFLSSYLMEDGIYEESSKTYKFVAILANTGSDMKVPTTHQNHGAVILYFCKLSLDYKNSRGSISLTSKFELEGLKQDSTCSSRREIPKWTMENIQWYIPIKLIYLKGIAYVSYARVNFPINSYGKINKCEQCLEYAIHESYGNVFLQVMSKWTDSSMNSMVELPFILSQNRDFIFGNRLVSSNTHYAQSSRSPYITGCYFPLLYEIGDYYIKTNNQLSSISDIAISKSISNNNQTKQPISRILKT